MSAEELLTRIDTDLKLAMRSKDEPAKLALRAVKTGLTEARKSEAGQHELSEREVMAVLARAAKQRREAIVEYEKAGRDDLVAKEQAELVVLERYLPQQLSEAEIEELAREVIAETGATSPQDMSRVMPVMMQRTAGRADGRLVNQVVRRLLG
jgi:uncharacterized protein